jgi:hypothetical protein
MKNVIKMAEPFDLKYTMVAIVWQESNFCQNKINDVTRDYGIFQIHIDTFKKRYQDILVPLYNLYGIQVVDNEIRKHLIEDDELSFSAALAEIEFWKKIYGKNWNKVWSSYNGGWRGSEIYSNEIKFKVKALKRYWHDKNY